MARYQPATYRDPVVLFWPGSHAGIRRRKKRLAPPLYWANLLPQETAAHIVPGAGHEQLFDEPYVQEIAKHLNAYLRDQQGTLASKTRH